AALWLWRETDHVREFTCGVAGEDAGQCQRVGGRLDVGESLRVPRGGGCDVGPEVAAMFLPVHVAAGRAEERDAGTARPDRAAQRLQADLIVDDDEGVPAEWIIACGGAVSGEAAGLDDRELIARDLRPGDAHDRRGDQHEHRERGADADADAPEWDERHASDYRGGWPQGRRESCPSLRVRWGAECAIRIERTCGNRSPRRRHTLRRSGTPVR